MGNVKTDFHTVKELLLFQMVPNILESLLKALFLDLLRSHLLMVACMMVLLAMEMLMVKVKSRM